MSEFYDANSPDNNSIFEDKSRSSIDIDEQISLCDLCQNVILVSIKDNKLLCTNCGLVYDPKFEYVQVQDQETTLDEISSQGELTFKDESIKTRKTLNRTEHNTQEKLEYVKKEFEKYRQIEIVDTPIRVRSLYKEGR